MDKQVVDNIVWWIPFKKLRNNTRELLNNISLIKNYIDMLWKINYQMEAIKRNINKITPQAYLNSIEIHLAEHCNLSCHGCSHFSHIANESYLDIKDFEKDIIRLYELSSGLIGTFFLMGGEPLLNKSCADFTTVLRKYFKKSKIVIISNGILLLKQENQFWKILKENIVEIQISRYDINIDYEAIKKKAEQENVQLLFTNEPGKKYTIKFVLSENRENNAFESFINCGMANACVQLKKGKLYPCSIPCNIEHFNKYYNKNLETNDFDYIDIYKAKDYQEILYFLSKPIPFCEYCDVKKWRTLGHWRPSSKNINEYFETNNDL